MEALLETAYAPAVLLVARAAPRPVIRQRRPMSSTGQP
jgi:hypothetical protein